MIPPSVRRVCFLALVATVSLLLVVASLPAGAQADPFDADIEQARAQVEQAQADADAAADRLEGTRQRQAEVEARVAQVQADVARLQEEIPKLRGAGGSAAPAGARPRRRAVRIGWSRGDVRAARRDPFAEGGPPPHPRGRRRAP